MATQVKGPRKWAYGSNTIVASLFFIGIVVFVALIAQRHFWRLDLSEGRAYTLSEQTQKILKSLDKPVAIKAFFATGAPDQPKAKDVLDTFQYYSKNISYEFIDPDRNPDAARKYEVRNYGTLVLEGYDKKQSIQTVDEQSLSNALLKLSRSEQKKIYFLTGHGERSLSSFERDGYSTVKSALLKENHVVEELNLMQQAQVPQDAAAVIVAGPTKKLFEQEIASLEEYIKRGGKLAVFLDPYNDAGMRDFLKRYGIVLRDDIVIDKLSRVFGGSYLMPVVTEYGFHKISEGFSVMTFFPEARSVGVLDDPPEGVHVEVLASTSPNAWGETNFNLLSQGQASMEEKEDLPGPVTLAVISEIDIGGAGKGADGESKTPAEKETEQPESKNKAYLLVVGDSDFITNNHFELSGNGDLFLNMANFMTEEEDLITIGSREPGGRPLLMTPGQGRLFFWTNLVLVPLFVILVGLGVYRVRRTQR